MGIPSGLRDAWVTRRSTSPPPIPIIIASPKEELPATRSGSATADATISGFKSAIIAGIISSGPVIIGCRVIPWAKSHINYTGQALLISSAAISAFFISADKTIMARAHKDSVAKFEKTSS